MTTFHEGDRVTVAGLPAHVVFVNGNGSVDVEFDDNDYKTTEYVPASIVEKIAEPLKVGAVIKRGDTEPPIGTVILDNDGAVWQHINDADEPWQPLQGTGYEPDEWAFISENQTPATVLHVAA